MAVALPDLIAWRDRLFEARLSGVREVEDSDGSRVGYRTDSEIAAALAAVNRAIADASRTPANTIRFFTSKGL